MLPVATEGVRVSWISTTEQRSELFQSEYNTIIGKIRNGMVQLPVFVELARKKPAFQLPANNMCWQGKQPLVLLPLDMNRSLGHADTLTAAVHPSQFCGTPAVLVQEGACSGTSDILPLPRQPILFSA